MADIHSPEFWDSVYRAGQTGWDLGGPTPVFCALAESGRFPPGKMIVLGAGRGYDARLFARHGFEVTAVDFTPEAVRDMRMLAEAVAPVAVLRADLFDLPPLFEGAFDYVLEYVTYCAIDPARRSDYAGVVDRLLRAGGRFIGLLFPIGDHPGGPPFAVAPDELIERLLERGFELQHREFPEASIAPRRGREELVVMTKGAPAG